MTRIGGIRSSNFSSRRLNHADEELGPDQETRWAPRRKCGGKHGRWGTPRLEHHTTPAILQKANICHGSNGVKVTLLLEWIDVIIYTILQLNVKKNYIM
jgi:hypothetical protein